MASYKSYVAVLRHINTTARENCNRNIESHFNNTSLIIFLLRNKNEVILYVCLNRSSIGHVA